MAKKKASDALAEMRKRYQDLTDAERENRELAIEDLEIVTVPGKSWDAKTRANRKNRPCYEFNVLRSHWRQVVNDWRKSRPQIKVRPVEDADVEAAELRQGIIRNIETQSNAERAYDPAAETLCASGYGAWRVVTEYSSEDSWDQDIRIRSIVDPLTSVWVDPHGMFGFIEETLSRAEFERRYPKADAVSFEAAKDYGDWFQQDSVRIAEYWRKIPVTKTLVRLSDGRTVVLEDIGGEEGLAQILASGVEEEKRRPCKSHRVIMSIVSGKEELDGPYETVFDRIPIIEVYANRHKLAGRWRYCGMVRHSRDPLRLVNYAFTTAVELLAKQPKATPVLTLDMLQGEGVQAQWDKSGTMDMPYLTFTPDPRMPGGMPQYLTPPPVHAAYAQFGQMAVDMIKATDGIYDASVGARSNETSGKAILARQQEGDTATFDYMDAMTQGLQQTGEIILAALPKVYDSPRAMRVIGKDGAEQFRRLYQEIPDPRTGAVTVVNDLSSGKYDVSVSAGPSYDTMRMEFVDALTQMSQGNPVIGQAVPDLIIGAMDFPKADEAAERLKLMLPPQIQQALQKDKEMPPEVMQAMQQAEMMMQQAQEMGMQLQQAGAALEQEKSATDAQKKELEAARKQFDAEIKLAHADLKIAVAEAETKVAQANTGVQLAEQDERAVSMMAEAEARAAQAVEQARTAAQQVTEALQMLAEHTANKLIAEDAPKQTRKQIQIVRDDAGQIAGAVVDEVEE